jgi:hypothetical protein
MGYFTALDALRTFRNSLYQCFDRRADALFELGDAILTAGVVPSPVHLSLEPSHRRGWGSLYAALDQGRIDAEALRKLLARHPLLAAAGGEPPVYAVDVSVWPRCDAESSPQRGYYYHPSRHSAGQPIVAGWAYQFIAQLGFVRESWTAPVDVVRVHPLENTNVLAAEQVKAMLGWLPKEEAIPLFVFDAGYDPVKVQQGLWRAGGVRSSSVCEQDAASTPIRVGSLPRPAGRGATGVSSTARTLRAGRSPPPSTPRRTPATGRFVCGPGRGYTPRSRCTRAAGAVAPRQSCAGRWC